LCTTGHQVITLEGTSVEAQGTDSIRLWSPLQTFIDWEFTVPDEVAKADVAKDSRLTELQKWGAVLQFWVPFTHSITAQGTFLFFCSAKQPKLQLFHTTKHEAQPGYK